ncbi:unnamed protein product [Caenorhabditis auriculariae]|uniref:SUMO-activating enzyme subunit n=1 Tax=Caenorhabditis auriculariae TaxID=2777116 RepID=A0A8S1HNU0_9PELO|nr:unnamed protein product [Caenorhabditis auriculariae]
MLENQRLRSLLKLLTWFLNALDNKTARVHVNRLCLACRIPLIESGSAGFYGQVSVILREKTECYECMEKPKQKTFPSCTIRNTPSEHIHCIVWSKHLFNQLFGEVDIDDDVSPDLEDDGAREDDPNASSNNNKNEQATENQENETETPAEVLKNGNGVQAMETDQNGASEEAKPANTRLWAEKVGYDPKKLFDKLFHTDINYLCKMDHLWKERKRPIAVEFEDVVAENEAPRSLSQVFDDLNHVWTRSECARVFAAAVESLRDRKIALGEHEILTWDKDDDDAMRFVAACANIRASLFSIQPKTSFDIKAMAGNIIPAIATTNAIVAGMMVTEALKIVDGDLEKVKNVFIARVPNMRGKILSDEAPQKPNPKFNPSDMTIKGLNDKVLKGALNMIAPDVMDLRTSNVIISSEEGETTDLETKKLAELSLGEGTMLECDDFVQKLTLKVILHSSPDLHGEDFEILRDSEKKKEEEETRKRKLSESEPGLSPPKKSKAEETNGEITVQKLKSHFFQSYSNLTFFLPQLRTRVQKSRMHRAASVLSTGDIKTQPALLGLTGPASNFFLCNVYGKDIGHSAPACHNFQFIRSYRTPFGASL